MKYVATKAGLVGVVMVCVVLVCWMVTGAQELPKSGTNKGFHAGFHGDGATMDAGPGQSHWVGVFYGVSYTEAGRGPLHRAAWNCSGEMVIREEKITKGSGGYCKSTHTDGGVIQLRWEVERGGPLRDFLVRGTFLSGEGMYAGIEGGYTWTCGLLAGSLYSCDNGEVQYRLP